MKKLFLSCMLIVSAFFAFGQVAYNLSKKDAAIVEEIKRRYDYERELILRQDFAALEKFYPDDFVVTNPFSQFINKEKVMERYRANIIKYSEFERIFEYFKVHGNTVFIVGREDVAATQDAARTDAGQPSHRRFTEVWMKRGKEWMKVLRHANHYTPEKD
jgi:ketosteroid isomerase-like protein